MRLNHSPDIFDWVEAVKIVEVKIKNTVKTTENPQKIVEDNCERKVHNHKMKFEERKTYLN